MKRAIAIFGGICSGKTVLADELQMNSRALVISKDDNIFRADMLAKSGHSISEQQLRAKQVCECGAELIVFDETIRERSLEEIKRQGYEVTAVYLRVDPQIREKRLGDRQKRQQEILAELSRLIGRDLHLVEREDRRKLWRDPKTTQGLGQEEMTRFDSLLREIYKSGSHVMKPHNPDPMGNADVDFVAEFTESDQNGPIGLDTIFANRVPAAAYKLRRSGAPIKYVIWDVGGVIYDFNTRPFFQFIKGLCKDEARYRAGSRSFSFNEYMRGNIDFDGFCQIIRNNFELSVGDDFADQIRALLMQGVGPVRTRILLHMKTLKSRGIESAILSNAIDVLKWNEPYLDIVAPDRLFYSFDTGYLKPEDAAYYHVLDSLTVEAPYVLFVDDKRRNTEAAEALGITSITFEDGAFDDMLKKKLGPTF